MKKFFKVVPTGSSKPLGVGADNIQSPAAAKQSSSNEKIQKLVGYGKEREKKKRKTGLDNDIFDTDATMDDCSENSAPTEEIVISDDDTEM
jgi:hypothetical protein